MNTSLFEFTIRLSRVRLKSCLLLILLAGHFTFGISKRYIREDNKDDSFSFTSPLYNVSLEENSNGLRFAVSKDAIRMGVPLLDPKSTVRFKIAEGDRNHMFKAHSRQVGDFVFLRIRQREKQNTPLNRELKDSYEFLVKAICKRPDSSNLETTTTVRLTVVDRNDASPMFTLLTDRYETTISDQVPAFTDILQVEASDADVGLNGQVYYSFANRTSDFTVDPVTGWIRNIKPLRAGKYELKVKAEDRTSRLFYYDENQIQSFWTADVVITVTETKRSQPQLLVETKPIDGRHTGKEQLAAVLRVQQTEESKTVVGLKEDDVRHWFRLERREDEEWWLWSVPGNYIPAGTNVTVTAGSELKGLENTTATIKIELVSRHYNISFGGQSRISFNVEEDALEGQVVGQIQAEVEEEKDVNGLRYYLEPLEENSTVPFRLGEETGVLRVAGRLDFEQQREYQFNVIAKLRGFGQMASLLVEVFIMDSNDHSPVFAAKWARQGPIVIDGGAAVGTVLLKVDALDKDFGDNGKIGYKLSSDQKLPFQIDIESGEIILTSPLAKSENEWRCAVWAVDWGKPLPRSAILNLVFYRNGTKTPSKPRPVVVPEQKNSYAPKFVDLPTLIELAEDAPLGKIVTKIRATDADVGYSGIVRYATSHELFAIHPQTGIITVAASLKDVLKRDEAAKSFEVEVLASDLGQPRLQVKEKLKITVIDVNDNAPEFEKPWYRIHVSEDAKVGTVLLQVAASDEDSADGGKIGYRLANIEDSYIEMNEKNGKVKLIKALDREAEDVMRYTIVAFDYGIPQRMSFVNLTIEVDDVNDNPPICLERVTTFRIPEDFPDGGLVGCLAARDLDIGDNGRIRYDISQKESVPFKIDHHTGCVFVHSNEPLDYQRKTQYNLTIDVSDNAENVLSTSCQVLVELLDVDQNVHPPEFDDVAHEASVYENMPIGTEVYTVMASDSDDKDEVLRYSIVGGDGMGYFTIDGKGTIRTAAVLDREEQAKYWLTIEAADSSLRPLTAILHVFVRVLDRNDHRPQPVQPEYRASVKENSPANVVIVKVEATDGDDLLGTEKLTYKLHKGDPQSFFRIDSNSGYVTTSASRKLDREKQREHELWIQICDSGEPVLCSSVPVFVEVTDINDSAPQFTQPTHHHNVPANYKGQLVRVFAVDADEGENAKLFYNITEGDARFAVDEHGMISTSEEMGGDEVYPLTIQATDRGSPAQYAQTKVVLTATSRPAKKPRASNRKPVIAGKGADYRIPISDADPVGVTIGMLEATDQDGDPLWWSITSGNPSETFSIRAESGQLLLAKPIEHLPANVTNIVLMVKVTDLEDEDTTKVIIQLSRSPTQCPKFTSSSYETSVPESTAIGSQVFTIKAEPQDVGSTTKPVIYGIYSVEDTAMENKLRIEPSTGNVLVMESLDYEACSEIRLTVSARQGQLTSYANLLIKITDENDNAPRFMRKEMVVRAFIQLPIGAVVATVVAHDQDTGKNGVIKYSIASGNELGYYSLHATTGEITIARSLRDQFGETILTIRATDGGRYPLTDTIIVRIRAEADEEQRIRFTHSIYHHLVRSSTPLGSVLMVVSTQPNGPASYTIQQPCPYMEIHSLSGAVTLTKWLTSERAKSISCTVQAKTRQGATDSAKVVLKIINTNQHAPVFVEQVYRASIRENSPPGSVVLQSDNSPLVVQAIDRDSGPNALIGYRILHPSEPYFNVDFLSGTIKSRKPLNFEKTREWRFYVQASDMGVPSKSSPSPALVVVSVLDENDEAPKFEKSEYAEKLLLPSTKGVVVARPKAIDIDIVGKLRYYLKHSEDKDLSKLFQVNVTTGEISLTNDDMKLYKAKEYEIPVSVSDGLHSDSTLVRLSVLDSSKQSSGFRFPFPEYTVTVKENATYKSGESLLSLTAVGAREGSAITYKLLNEHDAFILHSGTGLLAMSGTTMIDREKESQIRLVAQALNHQDDEILIAQTVIIVNVEDVNDNAPQFVNLPYSQTINLDMKEGDKVLQVRALDKDYALNGKVSYEAQNIPAAFKLMKDGKIILAEKLTRPEIFEFEVTARDEGVPVMKSTESVRIEVVEKGRPLFTQQFYKTQIHDTAPKNTIVLISKAISSTDGFLVYQISKGNEGEAFGINLETGQITVVGNLNRESKEAYNLTVTATDVTRDNLQGQTTVQIKITSPKDAKPKFKEQRKTVSLPESTPTGQIVALFEAEGAGVSYALKGGDSVFAIDTESGAIKLSKPLDFEKTRRYQLQVIATTDAGQSEEGQLSVEITDVNDEPPVFVQPFSTAQLIDTAQEGQFVGIMSVTDEDSVSSLPSNHRLLYSIIDGDETLFDVDRQSGEVKLLRALEDDDAVEKQKVLNVSVSDGVYTAYGQLRVELKISGHRQSAPHFEQSQYAAAVRENNVLSNKSALLTVVARHGVPPLHYSLGGGKGAWPVRVDKLSGRIHPKQVLNFHEQNVYRIPLQVEDGLGRRAFSTLTLHVIDENDKPPAFVQQQFTSSVSASAKEGDAVLMVSATDEDQGDTLEYTMMGEESASQTFKIHPRQGTITVNGKLDAFVGQTISFLVKAIDAGNPPHHATAEVSLLIVSADVPVPKFSNHHYLFTVSEDAQVGTIIGKLQQVEHEIDQARFSLVDSSSISAASLPFSIEKHTGKLIVRQALDRESKEEWRFVVRADGPAETFATTMVTVRVADVDDNAPQFIGSYERLSISEDAPVGTSVVVFSATDRDRAPGGNIRFTLVEEIEELKIDADSGWLIVSAPLDRERQPTYYLTARAEDEGGLATTLKFRIDIQDVNDMPPVFDEPAYSVRLTPSEVTLGQTIAKMLLRDADLPPHNESRLFIARGNEDGLFKIDGYGRVTVQKPLENEGGQMRSYNLTLLAFDGVHSTEANMKIDVLPERRFECPQGKRLVNVSESIKVKEVILPGNSNLTSYRLHYQLVSTEDLPFVVDAKSGDLKLAKALDREKRDRYEFERLMTDKSRGIECKEKVAVIVEDENDETPVFTRKEYSVTMKENQPASREERRVVIRVEAIDKDRGLFGRVRYTLQEGHGIFVIDSDSGVIMATTPLDRESRAEYTLNVLASDSDPVNPRTSKALVKIEVADQNDNPPVFERKEYALQVMESESIGYSLLTLKAVGGDEGEKITYALKEGGQNELVKLDEKTGVLTLAQGLDFERSRQLSFVVVATDDGQPPLASEAKVTIEVLDENDNAPIFEKAEYKVEVKENAKKGTKIIKLEANDADSEHYGTVVYEIKAHKSEAKVPFTIDDSGWLLVDGTIDREKKDEYEMTVLAKDGGKPPLTAEAKLKVKILDENDNAPVFASCNMTAVVQEGVQPGHRLLSVSVKDADGTEFGGPIKLEVKGDGAKVFVFDGSGNLHTAARLNHSKKQKFQLTVIATDKGGRTSSCPLVVYVKEESKHPPVITPLYVQLNTAKGEFVGGIIGRIHAYDEDPKDMLRYAYVEESTVGPLPVEGQTQTVYGTVARAPHEFRVDAETGEVWAAGGIAEGLHAFNVSVTDGKYSSVSYVQVAVSAINEDLMEHAVSLRVQGVTPEEFFSKHERLFRTVLARHLNVRANDVILLSVQRRHSSPDASDNQANAKRKERAVVESNEKKKGGKPELDILFNVQRGGKRGLLKPDHVYHRLKADFQNILDESHGLKYQLITEMCTPGICQRGECRERVELDESAVTIVSQGATSFVSPHHKRIAECICQQGYGGSSCQLEVNKCATSPCAAFEMCVPGDDLPLGYECTCPPGLNGPHCALPACSNEGKCLEESEISIGGNGYLEVLISNEVETRMELQIEMKTLSTQGVIMHGQDGSDYHIIELVDGYAEYRWNAGSGEGVVRSTEQVADGKWHTIGLSRRGKKTQMTLDAEKTTEAESAGDAHVLNLHSASQRLTFGAAVERDEQGTVRIKKGIAACFRVLTVDGKRLAKTRQGLRLFNARTGCGAMAATPCSEAPCLNGATCNVIGNSYSCSCPSRYSGDRCEIDTEPCASRPCPQGIQCIPFHNNYLCKCPNGFTGKHCEMRGFREADSVCLNDEKKCGKQGICIPIPKHSLESAGYICNCTGTLQSQPCGEQHDWVKSIPKAELLAVSAVVLAILVLACCLVVICRFVRRRNSDPKYGEHVNVPHMRNTRVMMPQQVIEQPPPPLPPRRHHIGGQEPNRPMVQVRPFSSKTDKHSSSGRTDSRSPSIAGGSGKQQWKGHRDFQDEQRLPSNDSSEMLVGPPVPARYNKDKARQRSQQMSDDESSSSSGQQVNNRVRRTDRADRRAQRHDVLTNLNKERNPLGTSIQCLPTTEDEQGWGDELAERIGAAVKTKQDGRLQIGDTVLAPLINDDDYMTMHPRRPLGGQKERASEESQKRPLLDRENREGSLAERAPAPPAHKSRSSSSNFSTPNAVEVAPEMECSRVYDEINDINNDASERHSLASSTKAGAEGISEIRSIDASENGDEQISLETH